MNLLLLHGALGTSAQMEPLRGLVGGTTIDLTGHGTRAIPDHGITFNDFLADIESVFAALEWETADLFGYSMGGYAAMLYAAGHPERVRSVVTVGTKYLWTAEGLQKELRMLNPDAMATKVPAFAEALAAAHGASRWRDLVSAIAQSMRDLAASPLLTAQVCARVQCPVLLCVGDGDTTAVPEDTHTFALNVPQVRVQVLPNTKHPFDTVDHARLAAELHRFWNSIDPGR